MPIRSDDEIVAEFAGRLNEQFQKLSGGENRTAGEPWDSSPEERRRFQRGGCPVTRLVAPWDGGHRPNESEFRSVMCRDLSEAGLSFWSDERPTCDHVIVKFEMSGEVAYVKARVIHTSEEPDPSKPALIIGCEFEGRLGEDDRVSA